MDLTVPLSKLSSTPTTISRSPPGLSIRPPGVHDAPFDLALVGEVEQVLFGLALVEEDPAPALARADGVEEVLGLRFGVFRE